MGKLTLGTPPANATSHNPGLPSTGIIYPSVLSPCVYSGPSGRPSTGSEYIHYWEFTLISTLSLHPIQVSMFRGFTLTIPEYPLPTRPTPTLPSEGSISIYPDTTGVVSRYCVMRSLKDCVGEG
ncbi:hypothetical protein EX30DRAFT_208600 [Ascodesmis nigricans]|uniref:Uncharacterized protein n=1 Tax=Ascodesmis nigricans TaxID=341454 RepID=A0A4S2MJN8_9PEZI|nr:hypothetical protein EX30DRAFT_208600 [Ascodesmis nigricans]